MLHEADHVQALHLLQEEKSGKVILIAPDLLLVEFASLIAKRVRRKQISAAEADHSFRLMDEAAPALFETRPLVSAALDLALRHQMSLWDCVYLALAIEMTVRCLPPIAGSFAVGTAGTHHCSCCPSSGQAPSKKILMAPNTNSGASIHGA